MALENKLVKSLRNNKEFMLAASTYAVGSAIDYFSTAFGLTTNQINEMNPLIQSSISHFGVYSGLLIPKLFICSGVIAIAKYTDGEYILNKRMKFKAKYLLYPGAIITSAIGLSWLVDKYFIS